MTTKLVPIVALSALFTAACIGDTGPDDVGSASDPIACATNADCPDGLECEQEHGESFCKPHGGDDGGQGGQGAGAVGGGDTAAECQIDQDCPAGMECEHEHGTSFCKPHGGD